MKTLSIKGALLLAVAVFGLGFAHDASAQTATAQSGGLNVVCSANLSTVDPTTGVGVTWTAYPSGGSELYGYSWSGTDGLTGGEQSISAFYQTSGTKTATVLVTSGSKTGTATCSANVQTLPAAIASTQQVATNNSSGQIGTANTQPNVTVYTTTPSADNSANLNADAGQSGVYLTQVPYTGPMDNWKLAAYVIAFLSWSFGISYWFLKKKYGAPAGFAPALTVSENDSQEFSLQIASLRKLGTFGQ